MLLKEIEIFFSAQKPFQLAMSLLFAILLFLHHHSECSINSDDAGNKLAEHKMA
jgi:hypothetical protein